MSDLEYEEFKEMQIKKWTNNGMPKDEAEQLMYESENDAHAGDSDIENHFDITIDERAAKYGGFGLTEDEEKKLQDDS